MKCICKENLGYSGASAKRECGNCGRIWIINTFTNKCECGILNPWTSIGGGKFQCPICGIEINITFKDSESYITENNCNICKDINYVLMVSPDAFKCLVCNTIQKNKMETYSFIKGINGTITAI